MCIPGCIKPGIQRGSVVTQDLGLCSLAGSTQFVCLSGLGSERVNVWGEPPWADLGWPTCALESKQVTKPKVERLSSPEGSITHLIAREAVLGFFILSGMWAPCQTSITQMLVASQILVRECCLWWSVVQEKSWSASWMQPEVMGHDDFTWSVIDAPLPTRLESLSSAELREALLNKNFLRWKLYLRKRCFISPGVYGPVKYYVAFIFYFLIFVVSIAVWIGAIYS